MKFTCPREPLASAFQLAASVAPSRTTKGVTQNVKATVTEEGKLLLEATDQEVSVCVTLTDVDFKTHGSVLLPVQRTGSILRECSDASISIESEDTGVLIRAGRSRFKLPSANADEFPRIPTFTAESYHEIAAGLFKEMIRRTVFATDAESSRYALGGVLMEMEGESVLAVATDGRRLARMQGKGTSFGGHQTVGANTIIPVKAMQLLDRAINDKDGSIEIAARENELMVRTAQCVLTSRLVEGRYPNWRQVIPTRDKSVRIELTVGPLFAGLRQAAVVVDQESRGIDFKFGNGTLKMEANTAEIGESQVELPIAYDGEDITVTLDNRFVADFCKVLPAESTIVLDIEAANRPALLTTEDGYAYVIMPITRDH